ncbi:MAG: hypothetical protein KYX66_06750 [Blastomonas fulva]|uniref:hypothetical protein n=1 Tax=Blastomonas fulva TaxID=1550728 RepID=UPI0024E1C5C4|nr:hypothetical protein [Blastomonas fulva]MDK2756418.1 hypothetical protein [Blastomonas fulva]
MDHLSATPQAILTLAYAFAALFAITGAVAWLRLVNRRSAQSNAGGAPDLRGFSNAATSTALAMLCAGVAFLFSLLI